MNDSSEARIHPLLSNAALVVVFLLIALLASRQVASLDVGFHLRAGEQILSGGGWPAKDAFTFTLSNRDYVDTSWGYQVLLALTHRAGGPAGLVILHLAAILGVFGLLLLTARLAPAGDVVLPGLLLLGAIASELRFEVRPEIFSHLLLALTLYLLHRYAERPGGSADRRLLWALPVIQLAWANTHSLFILGWAAMGCFVAGLWIRDRSLDLRLAGWSVASAALTLINPYGWRGVLLPFQLASRMDDSNVFAQSIGEFVSPFSLQLSAQFPFYPRPPLWAFRIFAVLAVVALVSVVRRKRWWCAFLWLPFFVLSAQMIRNLPLLVIACLPWMAWSLDPSWLAGRLAKMAGWRLDPRRLGRLAAAGAAVVLGVSMILLLRVTTDAYYLDTRRLDRTGLAWNHLTLPVDATEHALKVGLDKERALNHLNFGGWLMWSLKEPIFIDGRLEVVGEEFYERYRNILENEEAMEEAVERYGLRWIIFPYITNPKLLIALTGDPRWRVAYLDHLSVIFIRFRPEAEPWMDPHLIEINRVHEFAPAFKDVVGIDDRPPLTGLAAWLDGLWHRQSFPSYNHGLGLFHYYRGEFGKAADRFAMAVEESQGRYYENYNNLGSALFHLGHERLAKKAYEQVLRRDPGNLIATTRMKDIRDLSGEAK